MTSQGVRCFVGLALDEENSAALHERATSVLDARDWKLHEREDYHLTLCFLGEVAPLLLPTLRSNLALSLRGLSTPELAVRGVGIFGEPTAPRVLWAAVAGSASALSQLMALRQAAATAIEASAIAWDRAGTFTPHVTLARPRRRACAPEDFTSLSFDWPWSPRSVTLFGSVPGAQPHYPHLDSFSLG